MNRGSEGIYGAWISTDLISCKHDESSSSGGKSSFQRNIYICIIYIPNLGLTIADVGQEREQSRFRGSMEGAKRSTGGARESINQTGIV